MTTFVNVLAKVGVASKFNKFYYFRKWNRNQKLPISGLTRDITRWLKCCGLNPFKVVSLFRVQLRLEVARDVRAELGFLLSNVMPSK